MKCFEYNNNSKNKCGKESCRYWIDHSKYQNCCLIAANEENSKIEVAIFLRLDLNAIDCYMQWSKV